MANGKHIPLSNYFDENPRQAVFELRAVPNYSPVDFNLEFLRTKGWSVSVDRFRFHFQTTDTTSGDHPLKKMLASQPPHILIRKLDKEEDYFAAISIFMDGKMRVFSNDEDRAHEFLEGLVLGFPPSFKERSDLTLEPHWETGAEPFALFCGMLAADRNSGNLIHLIRNPVRIGALQNLYNTLHICDDDEIVVLLDGDDWFADNGVLKKVNEV